MNEDPTEAKYRRAASLYDQDAEDWRIDPWSGETKHVMDLPPGTYEAAAIDHLRNMTNYWRDLYHDEQAAHQEHHEPRRPDWIRRSYLGAVATIVLAGVFSLGYLVGRHQSSPHCPTEDSCTADYRDGEWVIEEVTP